uniref:MATH domain-containing protein n=1 Tax=Hordeum vulgare subsp. vulgare TaxID=112509 RepID=A0A8I6X1P3_HORVV
MIIDDASTSTLTTTVTTGSHILRINGYTESKFLGNGVAAPSGEFEAAGHRWRIHYYPNGGWWNNVDGISLALSIADKYVLSHVNANVRFSLVPHDGNKPAPAKRKQYNSSFGGVFKFNGHVIGERSRFMGRDQLEKSGYVVDDCLIVRCDIDVVVTSTARATDACDDLEEAEVELPCSSMDQEDMCKHGDNVTGGHTTDREDASDMWLGKMMMHPMASAVFSSVFSCFADFF